MTGSGCHLYVYYRVPVIDAASLRARVVAMQDGLFDETGVRGRLTKRPAAVDGEETWMEIYEHVPSGFEARLEAAAATSLPTTRLAARRIERFVDFPDS